MKTVSIVGLSLENDGVGSIVDAVAQMREASAVVLRKGGSQRGSFVRRDGCMHKFSQFGSASLIRSVKTYVRSGFVLNPAAMMAEAASLEQKGYKDIFNRTVIDSTCAVCTPYHTAFSRLARKFGRYQRDWTGSIFADEFNDRITTKDIMFGGKRLKDRVASVASNILETLSKLSEGRDELVDPAIFETFFQDSEPLLECYDKFRKRAMILHPDHASELFCEETSVIQEGWSSCDEVIGVTRTFRVVRKTGEPELLALNEDDDNNYSETENKWLGGNVVMKLNPVTAKQHADAAEVKSLAVTHCDKLRNFSDWKFFDGEKEVVVKSKDAVDYIAQTIGVPVVITSHGKLSSDKMFTDTK